MKTAYFYKLHSRKTVEEVEVITDFIVNLNGFDRKYYVVINGNDFNILEDNSGNPSLYFDFMDANKQFVADVKRNIRAWEFDLPNMESRPVYLAKPNNGARGFTAFEVEQPESGE